MDETDRVFMKQGAEAKIFRTKFYNKPCIVKERFHKSYRHAVLDKILTTQRIKAEARAMLRCRMNGIPTPPIYMIDIESNSIYMEYVENSQTVREYISSIQQEHPDVESFTERLTPLVENLGKVIAKMHSNNIIHGDLTTSNFLLKGDPVDRNIVVIDFGLSSFEAVPEDKGVDLYVLERAFLSTHPNSEQLFQKLLDSYASENEKGSKEVLVKLEEVRLRGRKRTMVG